MPRFRVVTLTSVLPFPADPAKPVQEANLVVQFHAHVQRVRRGGTPRHRQPGSAWPAGGQVVGDHLAELRPPNRHARAGRLGRAEQGHQHVPGAPVMEERHRPIHGIVHGPGHSACATWPATGTAGACRGSSSRRRETGAAAARGRRACTAATALQAMGFPPGTKCQAAQQHLSVADAGSPGDCASACLSNCSCTAYAYKGHCLVWSGELRNAQRLPGLLLCSSEWLPPILLLLLARARRQQTIAAPSWLLHQQLLILSSYSACSFLPGWLDSTPCEYRTTRRLSSRVQLRLSSAVHEELLPEAWDGELWLRVQSRGTLPGHTAIAVKRLEGSAHGEKQFRTEVSTLGAIQHVNLIHIRGTAPRWLTSAWRPSRPRPTCTATA